MIDANVKRGSAELAVLSLLEKETLHGYRIVWQPPVLRHFTARFEGV